MAQPAPPSSSSASSWPLRIGIVLLALGMFGCDHATKLAAETKLAGSAAMPIVSGVLELRYTRNDDTAFSLLHTFGIPRTPSVLLAAASVALLSIVAMWFVTRRKASKAQHVAFALVVAGALGNVIDRAMRGYVVDFIHLTRWPVFNVADIAVVAGVILLVLAGSLKSRSAAPASGPPAGPPAPG